MGKNVVTALVEVDDPPWYPTPLLQLKRTGDALHIGAGVQKWGLDKFCSNIFLNCLTPWLGGEEKFWF